MQDNEIIVLDALSCDEIKTKQITNLLKNLNVNEKALIVLPENDKNIVLSARNIKGVDTTYVGSINTYEVLNHTKCIILKDAVSKLEEEMCIRDRAYTSRISFSFSAIIPSICFTNLSVIF